VLPEPHRSERFVALVRTHYDCLPGVVEDELVPAEGGQHSGSPDHALPRLTKRNTNDSIFKVDGSSEVGSALNSDQYLAQVKTLRIRAFRQNTVTVVSDLVPGISITASSSKFGKDLLNSRQRSGRGEIFRHRVRFELTNPVDYVSRASMKGNHVGKP